MRKRWIGIGLTGGIILAGCAVGPNYRTPETPTPTAWSSAKSQAATTQPTTRPTTQPADIDAWWKSLRDPVLDSLLARAVETNLDLRIATARVRQARADRNIAAANFWPQVNTSGSYAYRGSSRNTGAKSQNGQSLGRRVRNAAISGAVQGLTGQGEAAQLDPGNLLGQAINQTVNSRLQQNTAAVSRDTNLFQLGFDATWELDVFGGIRRSVEVAEVNWQAAVETRRDVLVSLLSEVALNYVELRGFQRQLDVTRQNIQAQRDTVDLIRERLRAGFVSELDLAQSQTQLATTESQVPALESAIRQAIYQLSVLLGKPPETLLAELAKKGPLPAVPTEIPVGLPSDLLRRRSDVRAAERQLAAATAQIGVATADLFPRFNLTGSLGPQSRNINHLFDRNSLAWSVGPGFTWPIFAGGRIRANIELQTALREETLAGYEQTVLTAFQDVENALIAFLNEQVRYRYLAEAVSASQRSADISNELYSRGLTEFLNVLESQRALYTLQDQLVQSETTVITNLIALYKALGGGWTTPQYDTPGTAAEQ